jgi:hypothetical protein
MPCKSYDDDWRSHDFDDDKIRELKKQADMLARIACKALDELEANKIEDLLLLRNDEVRTWWMKHKEDDRKAREAREAQERRASIRKAALAKLSKEEKEVLGIAKPKTKRTGVPSFRVVFDDEDQGD